MNHAGLGEIFTSPLRQECPYSRYELFRSFQAIPTIFLQFPVFFWQASNNNPLSCHAPPFQAPLLIFTRLSQKLEKMDMIRR